MRMSPSTPPSRRSRAKPGDDSATATPRKTRSRKAISKPQPEIDAAASVDVVALHPDPAELTGMIATAAYFLAAERNFAPGRELDDWLEAERRVRGLSP